jgi:hypothetical protein
LKCGFDPTTVTIRDKPAWVALSTSDIPLPTNFPRAEDVLKNNALLMWVFTACTPDDIRRFLVWKDCNGKTTIRDIQCPFLGQKGSFHCNCPKRLASNTVEGIINQLVNIFDDIGLGRDWNIVSESGNPASAQAVKEYLKLIRVEQAKSHVLPKQAKPIFLTKVKAISSFIDREIKIVSLSLREKFTLYRDQAWWKIQFFAGDRAGDLALEVAQEVKILTDGSGLVFQHTFGKTLRGSKGKSNSFVIKRCNNIDICPVKGLIDYVNFCRSCKVDLTRGYLFRVVSEIGSVLDEPVSYSVVYQRLIYYLTTLGIYEGETPHSFRAGCAIIMALTDSVENVEGVMNHISWFSQESAEYYGRKHSLVDSTIVASKLANSVGLADNVELEFRTKGDYSELKKAFP